MTKSRIALMATLAVALFTGAAQAEVAVVNVQKAFDALKEKLQIEADLQTQADKVKQEDQSRQQQIGELKQDLSILANGTSAFQKKAEELERAALSRQVWLSFQQNKLNRERALRIEAIYKRMLGTIGRVAKQSGFKLVLFKEPEVKFANVTKPEQISALIQVRKVLWSAEELDLTEQVVAKMNTEFNAGN